MLILSKKGLFFELKPQNLEDLWVLYNFISQKDIICSKTTRKIKLESSQKQITKIIYIELKVKKVEFKSETLRVQGEVLNENDFCAIGQSHSFQFRVNDIIKIKKEKLLKFQEKLLKNSVENKNSCNLLILLDREDLIVSEFGNLNYKILFSKKGLGSKKIANININENEEKFQLIKEILIRNYENIIVAGPGIYKENFSRYIKNKTKNKIHTIKFSEVDEGSIQKAIKYIQKEGILTQNQLSKERIEIDEFLKLINLNLKYAYGLKEIEEKANLMSIKKLLITNKFIEKQRELNQFEKINNIMFLVEKSNGEIIILNSKYEPGKILDGLGGIGGILRY